MEEVVRLTRAAYSLTYFVLVLVTQRKMPEVLHKEHLVKDFGLLEHRVLGTLAIVCLHRHFISNVTEPW